MHFSLFYFPHPDPLPKGEGDNHLNLMTVKRHMGKHQSNAYCINMVRFATIVKRKETGVCAM